MPNLDKTGPQGQGPATGWGRGPCSGGLMRGRGGRYGRGKGWCWYMPWTGRQMSKEDELKWLAEEKEALKQEIEAIENEIQEVKKAKQ